MTTCGPFNFSVQGSDAHRQQLWVRMMWVWHNADVQAEVNREIDRLSRWVPMISNDHWWLNSVLFINYLSCSRTPFVSHRGIALALTWVAHTLTKTVYTWKFHSPSGLILDWFLVHCREVLSRERHTNRHTGRQVEEVQRFKERGTRPDVNMEQCRERGNWIGNKQWADVTIG